MERRRHASDVCRNSLCQIFIKRKVQEYIFLDVKNVTSPKINDGQVHPIKIEHRSFAMQHEAIAKKETFPLLSQEMMSSVNMKFRRENVIIAAGQCHGWCETTTS